METANYIIRLEDWAGIRELTLMSIGTDKGSWWADPSFGSELWILRQAGKVDSGTAGTFQQMLAECLAWLTGDGLAEKIICSASPFRKNGIEYTVTVEKPGKDPVIVKDTWYGLQA
jgi:phage gp46-like protein